MFNLSFTSKDLIRAIWTFVFGALSFAILQQSDVLNGTVDWKALAVGALAAGLSAVKNLIFADGSTIKG